jgi:FKBP-type peptidyl-prolyl cis-trans isomerase FklB
LNLDHQDMKKVLFVCASILMAAGNSLVAQTPTVAPAAGVPAAAAPSLTNNPALLIKKASYVLGLRYGKQLREAPFEMNIEEVTRGATEGFTGKASDGSTNLMSDQEVNNIMRDLRVLAQMHREEEGRTNLAKADAWLAENKTKDGIVTATNGLQYQVLSAGTGNPPARTDTVTVNYKATVADGTEFESTYKRGQPTTMALARFPKGVAQALEETKVGGKVKVFVPPALGYGMNGHGKAVGPNELTIWEIELVGTKTAPVNPNPRATGPVNLSPVNAAPVPAQAPAPKPQVLVSPEAIQKAQANAAQNPPPVPKKVTPPVAPAPTSGVQPAGGN